MVATAYHQGRRNSREGCIVLIQIEFAKGSAPQVKIVQRHVLPMQDVPKSISFDNQGSYLVCVTDIVNSIHVWGIKDEAQMDKCLSSSLITIISPCRFSPCRLKEIEKPDVLMNALGDGLQWLDVGCHIHVAQGTRLSALYIISIDGTVQDRW